MTRELLHEWQMAARCSCGHEVRIRHASEYPGAAWGKLLEVLCQDHLAKVDGHTVRMWDETVEQLTLAGVA